MKLKVVKKKICSNLNKKLTAVYMTAASTIVSAMPVSAAGVDTLNQAKSLLSKGAIAAGSILAVWGLVSLGLAFKDHNGPGIQQGIMQIIGGGIIIAAGTLVASVDLTMTP